MCHSHNQLKYWCINRQFLKYQEGEYTREEIRNMLPESFFKKPDKPPIKERDDSNESQRGLKIKKKKKKGSKVDTEFIHQDNHCMNKLDLKLM